MWQHIRQGMATRRKQKGKTKRTQKQKKTKEHKKKHQTNTKQKQKNKNKENAKTGVVFDFTNCCFFRLVWGGPVFFSHFFRVISSYSLLRWGPVFFLFLSCSSSPFALGYCLDQRLRNRMYRILYSCKNALQTCLVVILKDLGWRNVATHQTRHGNQKKTKRQNKKQHPQTAKNKRKNNRKKSRTTEQERETYETIKIQNPGLWLVKDLISHWYILLKWLVSFLHVWRSNHYGSIPGSGLKKHRVQYLTRRNTTFWL